MLRVLLIAATMKEAEPLIKAFKINSPQIYGPPAMLSETTDLLITGVGSAATALAIGRWGDVSRYSNAIQFGICGAFSEDLPIGSCVAIREDCFGDVGAETQGPPIDLFEMGLMAPDSAPFHRGFVCASEDVPEIFRSYPRVRGVTVNRVLSNSSSISFMREKFDPQVVSMEGAAFLFACRLIGLPGIQVRAVSDLVGPRDKSLWRIDQAISAICKDILTL